MRPDFAIRPARSSDAPALARLRFALRSRPTNVESEQDFFERCASWMSKALAQENWRCWVAEDNERVVAALWLQLIEKIPNPVAEAECHGYITNFFVAESARGNALGSRLLAEVLDWCRQQRSSKGPKINSIVLWPTERSRSLYKRQGFDVSSDVFELVLGTKR